MITQVMSTPQQILPVLPDAIWVGWLKKFRDWVEPTTDGALEGVFLAGSVVLGMAVGRHVGIHYGRLMHANLYGALIGSTGVPRKTTVLSRGLDVIRRAFTGDFLRVTRSIGSGEGLLELFCDDETHPKTGKVTLKPVPRQRVLLDEPEFCNLLKKARRPGTANITEILLSLYDGDDFSPRTRTKPIKVEQPFFSLITTSTPENLEATLIDTNIECGLLPRFATFYCTPREPMAYPPPPNPSTLSDLASELQGVYHHAIDIEKQKGQVVLSEEARLQWEATFKDMVETMRQEPSVVAAIMARVPAMVMKWALIYAVQEGHLEVSDFDLARATLVGTYLLETARLVPCLVEKSRVARVEAKIIATLQRLPGQYLSSNQIHRLVSGRVKAEELRRSLASLTGLGVLKEGKTGTGITAYRLR